MRLTDPVGCNLDNCERASDHILHQKKCESDNRLFPDYPLYCEGLPRPVLRGVLHLVCLLLLPFGMLHLVMESDGSRLGSIAAIVYISTNIFCYGFSAMYHVGRWSAHNEILLQKIDHCGIAILTAGTFFPSSVLLLPIEIGFPFLIMTLSACIWTCYHIWHLRPSSTRQIIVIATLLPFMPFLSPRMSTLEFWGTIFTMVFQVIGATVFLNKKPDPWPSSFGYHEIFHVFVVLAGICVYFTNWSIIRRTCNPYSTHSDITDLLLGTLWSPII
jgi:hemolysin III